MGLISRVSSRTYRYLFSTRKKNKFSQLILKHHFTMSGNKEISKETKPAIQPKVVDDGAEASNSVSEERVAPSGLASLVGEDLLDSDEDDGSFNGEESGSGDDSEKDSEDENTEEASSETEKRATLNNLNDEQLFGLGASTGHNDNESESDSENDDE